MFSPTSSSSFLGVGSVLVCAPEGLPGRGIVSVFVGDGFDVRLVNGMQRTLEALRVEWIDALIILADPGSDVSPAALCRLVRHEPEVEQIAIVVVGSGFAPNEVVKILRSGADDCLTIDLGWDIIIARVKAVLRRCAWGRTVDSDAGDDGLRDDMIRIGEILIRPSRYGVYVSGKSVELTVTEFRVINLLASRPHQVFERDAILEAVYGHDADAEGRSIDSHIYTLRRKLGSAGRYIETVRSVGYRIVNGSNRDDVAK